MTDRTENDPRLEDIKLVPKPSKDQLNDRQLIDYREHRRDLCLWLLTSGKDPAQAEGYAQQTVKVRVYRMDRFYRWVWDTEGGYTLDVTTDHADRFVDELAYTDKSNTDKNNYLKALKMLFKWRHHKLGSERWEPKMRFKSESRNPPDYLTKQERVKIREAALEYGSVPHPHSLSRDERAKWKAYLAQRFEKPMEQITKDDWARANSFKIPSLVWTSLDAGLRPIEVERAVTSWVDIGNGVLRIPKEQSSKNKENWIIPLRRQTTDYLEEWQDERQRREMYADTDALWLTREGNPYQSRSLIYLLKQLCEIAGIEALLKPFSIDILENGSTACFRPKRSKRTAIQNRKT